jgi:hypothetical protein
MGRIAVFLLVRDSGRVVDRVGSGAIWPGLGTGRPLVPKRNGVLPTTAGRVGGENASLGLCLRRRAAAVLGPVREWLVWGRLPQIVGRPETPPGRQRTP